MEAVSQVKVDGAETDVELDVETVVDEEVEGVEVLDDAELSEAVVDEEFEGVEDVLDDVEPLGGRKRNPLTAAIIIIITIMATAAPLLIALLYFLRPSEDRITGGTECRHNKAFANTICTSNDEMQIVAPIPPRNEVINSS